MKKIIFLSLFVFCGLIVNAQDWIEFNYPTVNFTDTDGESLGAQTYHRLVPEPEIFIQEHCFEVAKMIYFTNEDPRQNFNEINYILDWYDGISAKSGAPPMIQIRFSSQHVENTVNSNPGDDDAVYFEIKGVLYHELTHGYQLEPKNAGGYSRGTDNFGFIEGLADYVRIAQGYHTATRNTGGHWNDGYTTSGYFIKYLVDTKDPDFARKLNASCSTLDPWTWDGAIQSILGDQHTTQSLWDEYQTYVSNGVYADFLVRDVHVNTGENITLQNVSKGASSYSWTFEGANIASSTNTNPTISYAIPGIYEVLLEADNGNITTYRKAKLHVQSIIPDDHFDITDQENVSISAQHPGALPDGEDVDKLIDNSVDTKYVTDNSEAWVQIDASQKYIVSYYTITSANDEEAGDPVSWTFQGSHDGVNFETLDHREEENFLYRNQRKVYAFETKKAYRYFRIELASDGAPDLQCAELELFGINNRPIADFSVPTLEVNEGEELVFTNTSANASNYLWKVTEFPDSDSENLTILFDEHGTYTVQLTAMESDLSDTKSVEVFVAIKIPDNYVDIIGLSESVLTTQYNDSPAGEGLENIADDNVQTKFLTFNPETWIQIEAPANYLVQYYRISSANDAPERDPLSCTIYGSNDGTSFTELDSRTDQEFAKRHQTNTYKFDNTISYKYYRIELSNNSGDLLQISEFELFGEEEVTSALKEKYEQQIEVYPVCCKDFITIQMPDVPTKAKASFYSVDGKLLKQLNLSGRKSQVSVAELPPGFFLLSVKGEGFYNSSKLCKK